MRIVFVGDLVRRLEKEACPVAAEVTLGEAMELPVGSPMWSHCVRRTARPPSPELMHSELFKSVYLYLLGVFGISLELQGSKFSKSYGLGHRYVSKWEAPRWAGTACALCTAVTLCAVVTDVKQWGLLHCSSWVLTAVLPTRPLHSLVSVSLWWISIILYSWLTCRLSCWLKLLLYVRILFCT